MKNMKFIYSKAPKGTPVIKTVVGEAVRFVDGAEPKVLIGGGEIKTRRQLLTALRRVVRVAREYKIKNFVLELPDHKSVKVSSHELGRLVAENCILANYTFAKYKKQDFGGVESIYIDADKQFIAGVEVGTIVADTMSAVRDMANTPAGEMTPAHLADEAKKICKGTKAKVKVLSVPEMTKLKMGMVLAVGKGAKAEPKFIIIEYKGGPASQKPVVLVGKGVCFDSGGLSVKPADAMLGMHHDMAGGASVIGAIAIAAKLKLKKNVVALVPAVENAISGNSYRPGDIIRAMDGTTVEVLNTDAEGRLILGDALVYAERYKPRLTIDVATLTGAALIAVGKRACAIMTKDEELELKMRHLGETAGEYVWPLPLWDEYAADIKGTHGDIVNTTNAEPRMAGSILGGMFLAHFARNLGAWVHIDMAPRDQSIAEDQLAKGATGTPVRLLVRAIEEL